VAVQRASRCRRGGPSAAFARSRLQSTRARWHGSIVWLWVCGEAVLRPTLTVCRRAWLLAAVRWYHRARARLLRALVGPYRVVQNTRTAMRTQKGCFPRSGRCGDRMLQTQIRRRASAMHLRCSTPLHRPPSCVRDACTHIAPAACSHDALSPRLLLSLRTTTCSRVESIAHRAAPSRARL